MMEISQNLGDFSEYMNFNAEDSCDRVLTLNKVLTIVEIESLNLDLGLGFYLICILKFI